MACQHPAVLRAAPTAWSGTAAVEHVLLLESEAPKPLDAAECGWNHCQCWMEVPSMVMLPRAASWEQLMLLQ